MCAYRKRSLLWSLLATALICMVTLLAARTLRAEPITDAKNGSYRHVPVTLWLFPLIGTGGLANGEMETNLALSLGASGYARLRGFDTGVGGSWISERMTGAQVTVGLNYVGQEARGAQITAGVNLTPGRMSGLQVSSGYNHVGTLRGVQLGLVNFGAEVIGSQVGLINIGGKVRGSQIGLINLAQDADVSLGLISLVKNGQQHLALWGSDSAPLNVGVKLGSRHVYTLLAAGYQPQGGDQADRWLVGLGLGGHIPLTPRVYLDTDLATWHVNQGMVWTDALNMLNTLRVIGGYRLHERLALFVGATFNVLLTRVDEGSDFGLITGYRLTAKTNQTAVRVWPGFVAGFQI